MDPAMLTRSSNPSDRRAHCRAPYSGTLLLQCAGEGTWFDVQALDVSAGGFSFATASELRRGERLAVAVPDLEAYTVSAVVRHAKPSRAGFVVGIEFDEPLSSQLERCLGV
jgi:hypothetical protein